MKKTLKVLTGLVLLLTSSHFIFTPMVDAKSRSSGSKSSVSKKSTTKPKTTSSPVNTTSVKKQNSGNTTTSNKTKSSIESKKASLKAEKDNIIKKQNNVLSDTSSKTSRWTSSQISSETKRLRDTAKSKGYSDSQLNSYRTEYNKAFPQYNWLSTTDYLFLYWLLSWSQKEYDTALAKESASSAIDSIPDDTNNGVFDWFAEQLHGITYKTKLDLISQINKVFLDDIHVSNVTNKPQFENMYTIFKYGANFYRINSQSDKIDNDTYIYKVVSIKEISFEQAIQDTVDETRYQDYKQMKLILESILTNESRLKTGFFDSVTCKAEKTSVSCDMKVKGIIYDDNYSLTGNVYTANDGYLHINWSKVLKK